MNELAKTLNGILHKIQIKYNRNKDYIMKNLNKILTKEERRHIKYISFYRDILKVGVDSSAWLYCLHQKKDKILKELKAKEVKFHLV